MRIAAARETEAGELRVAVTPESCAKLTKGGAKLVVESDLGASGWWSDEAYRATEAEIAPDRRFALEKADVTLAVRRPTPEQVGQYRPGSALVCFLEPFREDGVVKALAERGVSAFSVELMPRSTIAQKMDALSSQHSIAGYYMVLLAAERLGKALPMMVTPSGAIQPARVLVIGAGVAGLQAIATAKRLGARVEAFDTRPVVKEQVESLGARFVEIDLGETGEEGGYAKELTDEQESRQREGLADRCAQADIVITTAQLFGRPAPVVVTREMLGRMKAGSMVVDYAVESGGNVEGSRPDEEVSIAGVRVIGLRNYPAMVAVDASRMYANNLSAFVERLSGPGKDGGGLAGELTIDTDDEIVQATLVTHGGKVVHPMIRERLGLGSGIKG